MGNDISIKIVAKDQASATVQNIEGNFEDAFRSIQDDLRAMKGQFEATGEDIVETFKDVGKEIAESLKKGMESASSGGSIPGIGAAGFALGPVAGFALKGLGLVGGIAKSALSGVASIVQGTFSGVVSVVKGVFTTAFNAVIAVGRSILSGITSVVGFAFDGLTEILDTVLLTPFKLVFNKITALAAGVSFGIGTKMAAEFQDGMSIAFALIPEQLTEQLKTNLTRQMEDLRAEIGVGGKLITDTLYNAISAGAKDNPIPLTEAALKFAVIGGQAEAADISLALFAQTINTLRKDMSEATDVADMYQATITEGIMKPQDLATQMGRVLPFVQTLNLDFSELLGIIAHASKTFRPEQLFTGLSGVLAKMLDPEVIKTAKEELGIALYDVKGQFIGAMEMFRRLSKANISDELLQDLFGEVESKKFFLALTEQMKGLEKTVSTVSNFGGSIDKGWAVRSESITLQFKKIGASIANVFSIAMDMVDEDVVKVMGSFQGYVNDMVTWLRAFADDGGWEKIKTHASSIWGTFSAWVPTAEEAKAAIVSLMESGVTAFSAIKGEFDLFKGAFSSFIFGGGEVDMSNSLLVNGFKLAWEYIKEGAADAAAFIADRFSSVTDDPGFQKMFNSISGKFRIIGEMMGTQLSSSLGIMTKRAVYQIRKTIYDLKPSWFQDDKDVVWAEKAMEAQVNQIRTSARLQMITLQKELSSFEIPFSLKFSDDETEPKSLQAKMNDILRMHGKTPTQDPMPVTEIDRLKQKIASIIDANSQGSSAAVKPLVESVEKMAQSVEKAISLPEETASATESTKKVSEAAEKVKASIEKTREDNAKLRSKITDLGAAQLEYMEENGRTSQEIIAAVNVIMMAIQNNKLQIARLQESLAI